MVKIVLIFRTSATAPALNPNSKLAIKANANKNNRPLPTGPKASIDVILTTGGTGLAKRDVTPEATLAVVDKVVPGLTEAMRVETAKVTQTAVLSRAVAGVRGSCLIINLPGSPRAVRECLEVILPVIPHAVEIIKGKVTEHKATHSEAALDAD